MSNVIFYLLKQNFVYLEKTRIYNINNKIINMLIKNGAL